MTVIYYSYGTLAASLIYFLVKGIKKFKDFAYFIRASECFFFKQVPIPLTGDKEIIFNWEFFCLFLVYMISYIGAQLIVTYAFMYALDAKVNQGVLTAIFSVSSIFSAVVAYFFHNEMLKMSHVSLYLKLLVGWHVCNGWMCDNGFSIISGQ